MKNNAAIIILLLCGCAYQPATIIVDKRLEDPDQIEQEIREGLEFFCQERGVDCDRMQHLLKIEVFKDPFYCFDIKANGCYWPRDKKVEIVWFDGIGGNALLHELLHLECDLENDWDQLDMRNKTGAQHSELFLDVVDSLKTTWREMKGVE